MSEKIQRKDKVDERPKRFTTKRILYAITFFLIFAFTVSELGLVSQQLHNGGNNYANYPGMEYKHDLGILLFACIYSLLYLIGHVYASFGIIVFVTFTLAVFWGTGAGVMYQVTPYRGHNCGVSNPLQHFGAIYGQDRFFSQCSRIVAIQGIAWALWLLTTCLFIAMIVHKVEFRPRPNVSIYGA